MQLLIAIAQSLSLVLCGIFILYVATLIRAYRGWRPQAPGRSEDFQWHFLIPCRDEEAVIGQTVTGLRGKFPGAHLWVIDDDSDDQTGAIVEAFASGDDRVHLVSRKRPEARTGKGDALNAAYRALEAWLPPDADPHGVVVGVFDADGLPAPECLDVCAAPHLFGDPTVGAVQIEVRILNLNERHLLPEKGRAANLFARTLLRMQDIEFRVPIAALQLVRRRIGTVGMGGNGQFTRLSALRDIDEGNGIPWRGSLLEDFELGLHVLLAGWRNEYTRDTYVEQEGLFDLKRLITQRTRWGQGNMQCSRYMPDAWSSYHVTNAGVSELTYYLIQPWLQILGTFVYPLPLLAVGITALFDPAGLQSFLMDGGWALFAAYLVVGAGQFAVWAFLYVAANERQSGWWRAAGWGMAYVLYTYKFYVTSWKAMMRILTGRSGWSKTRRNAEISFDGPIAKEA
ncbi:glycosyltransferase family 2 protein [Kitasatospora albolonga]|uniref:glycosyltransferase family 2 protein n=1 Tax=Kitasatospora albolonga TaxID=68173 RepID=UPI0031EF5994